MSATNINNSEVFDVTKPRWRRSSSSAGNGNCVEVACIHDAPWRSSRSSAGNGNCVEVAPWAALVAVRDSKLDITGDFPKLEVTQSNWAGLLLSIRTGDFER